MTSSCMVKHFQHYASIREFAFQKRSSGLKLLTDGELCAFPKTRLSEIFSESLLLCNIFFMIASRDQAILEEDIKGLLSLSQGSPDR